MTQEKCYQENSQILECFIVTNLLNSCSNCQFSGPITNDSDSSGLEGYRELASLQVSQDNSGHAVV